jgi:GntR family transcriptional regulator, transcriptional repressor for pyruvate dehydrogenase complex
MVRRQSLSIEVAEELRKMIQEQKLLPGDRIRTEAELCEDYDVSRTVIREAIARLRSEGLLESRQGIGVFVAEVANNRRFEIDWESIRTLTDTLEILEMRRATEVEAAGLCALRCNKATAANIRNWMEKTNIHLQDLENTNVHYDFDFHLAIAQGSGNPYFHQFLSFLQPVIVPRMKLSAIINGEMTEKYRRVIYEEHEAIVAAIEAKDEERARAAMRTHLLNFYKRLTALVKSLKIESFPPMDQDRSELMKEFVSSTIGTVKPSRVMLRIGK